MSNYETDCIHLYSDGTKMCRLYGSVCPKCDPLKSDFCQLYKAPSSSLKMQKDHQSVTYKTPIADYTGTFSKFIEHHPKLKVRAKTAGYLTMLVAFESISEISDLTSLMFKDGIHNNRDFSMTKVSDALAEIEIHLERIRVNSGIPRTETLQIAIDHLALHSDDDQ